MLLLILYGVFAIGFSFLCSIAEAVLLSITPSYIASLREKGKRSAKLLSHLKENVDRPLAAILSLNTIAHTVGAAGVGAQAAEVWGMEHSGGHAVGYASAVMTLLILVLSEIIPKTIGAVYWRPLAVVTARGLQVLIWILYPLVLLSELLTKMIGGGHRHDIITRDEVAAMAAISAKGGELEATESRIIGNLFRFRTLTAYDVMTPRTVILAFPETITVAEAMEQFPHLPVSRVPIYEGGIDHITGFVLKADILLAHANGQSDMPLSDFRRELRSVPADATLIESFDILLNQQMHLALVHDEYGGTDGLVTLEDVIETLLGLEIVDEADTTVDMQRLARERWHRRVKAMGLKVDDVTNGARQQPMEGEPEKGEPERNESEENVSEESNSEKEDRPKESEAE